MADDCYTISNVDDFSGTWYYLDNSTTGGIVDAGDWSIALEPGGVEFDAPYVTSKCDINAPNIDKMEKDIESLKREDQPMKNLFEVFVVNKDEEIIMDGERTVACDKEEAVFNVKAHDVINENKLKPRDVTILCRNLGEVRVHKEVQKVQIIKEEDK